MQTTTTTNLKTDKKRTILFESSQNWIESILVNKDESLASSLSIVGRPLIVYNMEKMLLMYPSIDNVVLPEGSSRIANLLETRFPSIQITEDKNFMDRAHYDEESVRIPLNSALVRSISNEYTVKPIVYPWDILKVMREILEVEVTETYISKDASIADSTILKGPCVIEDGVSIDDFNKIVGPIYIEKNTSIGTSNLLRKCVIGKGSSIGFGCEVARSLLVGKNSLSHHDVILDSIVGYNTWMGAFVGTTNVLLTWESVKYKLGDVMVSTALDHFGSVIGYNSAIGAGTITLPGRFIPPNSFIQVNSVIIK